MAVDGAIGAPAKNGPIAQIVALTRYARSFLQGEAIPGFFPLNSTCKFCERMVFVRLVKPLLRRWREVEVAKNPDEWFSYLKGRDVRGVRLLYQAPKNPQIPDRMAAGFVGGGGAWSMEVLLPGMRSEFWRGRWEVGNPDATDRRIWKASYGRVAEDGTKPFPLQNVEVTGERLLAALDAIHAFSARHGCNGFTDSFARAIGSLKGVGKTGYHQDLSPPGLLPPRALAVLDAAQSAWVFGGMGSWNDLGFEGADGEEYDRVSDQLYQTLTEAICVATNATESGATRFDIG